MAYANSLPDKLRIAQEKDEINMSYDELAAIAQYGFSLPGSDDLPQEEITPIALQAVQAAYGLSEGWHVHAEIYYSFFTSQIGESRWRVIIWHTGDSAFPSGIVELNARSGEVLRIAKNGTLPNEYIPYLERIGRLDAAPGPERFQRPILRFRETGLRSVFGRQLPTTHEKEAIA